MVNVSNASVNAGVRVSFEFVLFSFSWGKYPAVELLGHMAALFLVVEEPPDWFLQGTHPLAFLTNAVQRALL